jgi:16S rRNA (cytosine1402-N4)-methyltransferase
MNETKFSHQPVLLSEVIETFECLKDRKDPVFVDGTIGLAGHSSAIAEAVLKSKVQSPKLKIIAVDKDQDALKIAGKKLGKYDNIRFSLINDKFENIKDILAGLNIEKVDGILLDLGVSSMQLDQGERGFSFQTEAPLDMRMDQGQELTAREVVNRYPEKELVRIFSEYGEERFSKTITRKIIEERSKRAIETTKELADVVIAAVPAKFRSTKTSPATNVFRALRMEVNREVADLEKGIEDAVSVLSPGGKLAVISFHSIEDRVVKQTFSRLANPCICSTKQPVCNCGLVPQIKILDKKPIVPTEEEVAENPRARSAKLRIAERI